MPSQGRSPAPPPPGISNRECKLSHFPGHNFEFQALASQNDSTSLDLKSLFVGLAVGIEGGSQAQNCPHQLESIFGWRVKVQRGSCRSGWRAKVQRRRSRTGRQPDRLERAWPSGDGHRRPSTERRSGGRWPSRELPLPRM